MHCFKTEKESDMNHAHGSIVGSGYFQGILHHFLVHLSNNKL